MSQVLSISKVRGNAKISLVGEGTLLTLIYDISKNTSHLFVSISIFIFFIIFFSHFSVYYFETLLYLMRCQILKTKKEVNGKRTTKKKRKHLAS